MEEDDIAAALATVVSHAEAVVADIDGLAPGDGPAVDRRDDQPPLGHRGLLGGPSAAEEALLDMGFTDREAVRRSLVIAHGHVDTAVSLLTSVDASPVDLLEEEAAAEEDRLPMNRQSIEWPSTPAPPDSSQTARQVPALMASAAEEDASGIGQPPGHDLVPAPPAQRVYGDSAEAMGPAAAPAGPEREPNSRGNLAAVQHHQPAIFKGPRTRSAYPTPKPPAPRQMALPPRPISAPADDSAAAHQALDQQDSGPADAPADTASGSITGGPYPMLEGTPQEEAAGDPGRARPAREEPVRATASALPARSRPTAVHRLAHRSRSLSLMRGLSSSIASLESATCTETDRQLSSEEEEDLLAVIESGSLPTMQVQGLGRQRRSTHDNGHEDTHTSAGGTPTTKAVASSVSAPLLSAEWIRTSSKQEMYLEMLRMKHEFEEEQRKMQEEFQSAQEQLVSGPHHRLMYHGRCVQHRRQPADRTLNPDRFVCAIRPASKGRPCEKGGAV